MIDLNDYPISLPGQRTTQLLTLADVHRLCRGEGVNPRFEDFECSYPALTTQQRIALVKLAYHVAQSRGAETIASLTLDGMLQAEKKVCPLTLTTASGQAIFFNHGGVEPTDFLSQMMGWGSFRLWDNELDKTHLSNAVPMASWPSAAITDGCGAFIPTPRQLLKLIVELEKRVAEAIGSAGSEPWKLDTTFGASTASTSVDVGEVLHAHDYDFIIFPRRYNPDKLVMHNDAAPDRAKKREHWGFSSDAALVGFKPALPSFASFASPSAALALFVSWATRVKVQWQTTADKEFWAMAVYFVKLCCVTSGREFATTLATRPTPAEHHLPKLDDKVASCAHTHGADERHTRAFPDFPAAARDSATGKRKRSQQSQEEDRVPRPEDVRVYEVERVSAREDVHYSWRAARRGTKAERQCDEEVLKSAVWHCKIAFENHTEALVRAFDGGRGANLYNLLLGWPAVYDAVGEEGEKLRELRDKVVSAQKDVEVWLQKVVEHHQRDAANGVASA